MEAPGPESLSPMDEVIKKNFTMKVGGGLAYKSLDFILIYGLIILYVNNIISKWCFKGKMYIIRHVGNLLMSLYV